MKPTNQPTLRAEKPTNQNQQEIIQKFANYTLERYEPIIERLSRIQVLLPKLYGEGVKIPQEWLDGLLEEIINLDNKSNKESDE